MITDPNPKSNLTSLFYINPFKPNGISHSYQFEVLYDPNTCCHRSNAIKARTLVLRNVLGYRRQTDFSLQ